MEAPPDGLSEALFDEDEVVEPEMCFNHEAFALPEVWCDGDSVDQQVITERICKHAPSVSEDAVAYQNMEVNMLNLSCL